MMQCSTIFSKYTEQYLSGGDVTVAYNPEDVTSVWLLEDGDYTEFTVIESSLRVVVDDAMQHDFLKVSHSQASILPVVMSTTLLIVRLNIQSSRL